MLSRLDGIRVADVMDDEPVAVPGEMTIADAMHEYFLRYRYPWFPVVGRDGRYIGVVEYERAQHVAEEKQAVFKVNEIMQAEGDSYRVRSDDPLEALLVERAAAPLRRADGRRSRRAPEGHRHDRPDQPRVAAGRCADDLG